jgi:hypothetical protein
MDQKDLVDHWIHLDKQIKELTRQQAAVEEALGKHPSGTELSGHAGKIRVQDRAVLKDDMLKAKISDHLWRRITKRVVVADLLKTEVKRGKIDQNLINASTVRSKSWFKTIM